MENLGYASASAAFNGTASKLSAAIASGVFTLLLQQTAYAYGASTIASVVAAAAPSFSVYTSVMTHTTSMPTAAPTAVPSTPPTPAPTKYYTLNLTYMEFEVVTSISTLTFVGLSLVAAYLYYRRASQISRFQSALAKASMSTEDKARQRPIWRGLKKCARYLCCLWLCFRYKTPGQEEAQEQRRNSKRRAELMKEGCCRKCLRYLCCCYCFCRVCGVCGWCGCAWCCRCFFPVWCKLPEEDEEYDEIDMEEGKSDMNSGSLRGSGGLGGGGATGLGSAMFGNPNSPFSSSPDRSASAKGGAVVEREKKRWGGKVRVTETGDKGGAALGSPADGAGAKSFSIFSGLMSLFGLAKPNNNAAGGSSLAGTAADVEADDWAQLQRQIATMKHIVENGDGLSRAALSTGTAGDALKAADAGDEFEGDRERKKFRRGRKDRGESLDIASDEGVMGGMGGSAVPILTAADLASAARNAKRKTDSDHPSLNVPSLPSPNDAGFVSFRDNLKMLEARRVQEAKRSDKSGSLASMGAGGYITKKYTVQASGSGADAFLREEKVHFLGGQL